MPWCDECSRFWTPPSVNPDGTCPTCGRVIGEVVTPKAPWHFKLLVVSVIAYLGWRAWQGVDWLIDHV